MNLPPAAAKAVFATIVDPAERPVVKTRLEWLRERQGQLVGALHRNTVLGEPLDLTLIEELATITAEIEWETSDTKQVLHSGSEPALHMGFDTALKGNDKTERAVAAQAQIKSENVLFPGAGHPDRPGIVMMGGRYA